MPKSKRIVEKLYHKLSALIQGDMEDIEAIGNPKRRDNERWEELETLQNSLDEFYHAQK